MFVRFVYGIENRPHHIILMIISSNHKMNDIVKKNRFRGRLWLLWLRVIWMYRVPSAIQEFYDQNKNWWSFFSALPHLPSCDVESKFVGLKGMRLNNWQFSCIRISPIKMWKFKFLATFYLFAFAFAFAVASFQFQWAV